MIEYQPVGRFDRQDYYPFLILVLTNSPRIRTIFESPTPHARFPTRPAFCWVRQFCWTEV